MQLDCQNISQIKGNDPPNYDPLKMKEGKLIVDLSIPKICALKMKLTVDPAIAHPITIQSMIFNQQNFFGERSAQDETYGGFSLGYCQNISRVTGIDPLRSA